MWTGVMFHKGLAESVNHEDGISSMHCRDGTQLSGRMVLDATGHARKLVEFDEKFDPGYQVRQPLLLQRSFELRLTSTWWQRLPYSSKAMTYCIHQVSVVPFYRG